MGSRHRVTRSGIELIKRFEGYRAKAARLPDGRHVVGYGHTRSAREGVEVSPEDAEALLRFDLRQIESAFDELVFTPLDRNQTDALVAFAFSVGLDAFRRSNVLRRVNEGDLLGAAAALESWRRAEFEGEPLVVDALIRRRAAEKLLFLTPSGGFIAAPSSVLKPELDYAALPPRGALEAADLVASLEGADAAAERVDGAPAPAPTPETSPALAAAEKVSRRLQALFADEPEPASPAREADITPELATDPAVALAPGPAESMSDATELLLAHPSPDDQEPVEAPPPLVLEPEQLESRVLASEADFDRRIAGVEADGQAVPVRPEEQKESRWPYLALGGLTLTLFAIAIVIILRAQRMGERTLTEPVSLMGTILAVVGIVGMTTAVYFWLRTWGERGSKPEGSAD